MKESKSAFPEKNIEKNSEKIIFDENDKSGLMLLAIIFWLARNPNEDNAE
jgi:hypothetical protein|nr:MAG TPA: hypothetical protein [Caudoviricetes sp.]